jgi:hypothetical protein
VLNVADSTNQTVSCAITDGNDSWIPATQKVFDLPSSVLSVVALLELEDDKVRAYLWFLGERQADPSKLPIEGPSSFVELPYNPMIKCMPANSLYVYSHCTPGSSFAQADKFTVLKDTLTELGEIHAFPCPLATQDPKLASNQCRANIQSDNGYLVDNTLDPFDPVGVYNPEAAAATMSMHSNKTLSQARRAVGLAQHTT